MTFNKAEKNKAKIQRYSQKVPINGDFDSRSHKKKSKQAREQICAYHALTEQQQQQDHAAETSTSSNKEDNADNNIATPVNIKKLAKLFKTHCCALDFDQGFIDATFIEVE